MHRWLRWSRGRTRYSPQGSEQHSRAQSPRPRQRADRRPRPTRRGGSSCHNQRAPKQELCRRRHRRASRHDQPGVPSHPETGVAGPAYRTVRSVSGGHVDHQAGKRAKKGRRALQRQNSLASPKLPLRASIVHLEPRAPESCTVTRLACRAVRPQREGSYGSRFKVGQNPSAGGDPSSSRWLRTPSTFSLEGSEGSIDDRALDLSGGNLLQAAFSPTLGDVLWIATCS